MATNTLATNIGRTVNDFTDIKEAIIDKEVAVPSGTPTAEYGDLIRQIQSDCELKSGQFTILDNVSVGSYGQWETLQGTTARISANTATVGEDIYLIGGRTSNALSVYNTKSRTYKTLANMPGAQGDCSCVHKDGKIYAIGGYNGSALLNTNYVYTIATDTWETKSVMPTARNYFACIETDGNIYCIGGGNTNVNQVYNINTDSWSTKRIMPSIGQIGTCVLVGRNIHIIGLTASPYNQHYVYNIDTDSWSTLALLPNPRRYNGGCYYDGKIYVISGENSNLMNIYDVEKKTWDTGPSLPSAIMPQVSLIDSTIYAFSNSLSTLYSFTIERFIRVNPHSVIILDKDALLDDETILANVEVITGDTVSKLKVTEGTSGTIYEPLDDILITVV